VFSLQVTTGRGKPIIKKKKRVTGGKGKKANEGEFEAERRGVFSLNA